MLMKYVKNDLYKIGIIPGVKDVIWVKIIHFNHMRVIFLENLKTTKAHKYVWNIA